jgi:CRISPR-associated protein Csb2
MNLRFGSRRIITALEWLENLGSPQMRASGGEARAVVTHYVPVNDAAGPSKAMLQSVPLTRDRQPRTFARTWLDDDTVWLVWPDAEPAANLSSLTRMSSIFSRTRPR